MNNKEIMDWKSWDKRKLKSPKSLPLKIRDTPNAVSAEARSSQNATAVTNVKSNNFKLNKIEAKENDIKTLENAKTDLIYILQKNEEEKKIMRLNY